MGVSAFLQRSPIASYTTNTTTSLGIGTGATAELHCERSLEKSLEKSSLRRHLRLNLLPRRYRSLSPTPKSASIGVRSVSMPCLRRFCIIASIWGRRSSCFPNDAPSPIGALLLPGYHLPYRAIFDCLLSVRAKNFGVVCF